MKSQNNPIAHWKYSSEDWNKFVDIEKRNKKEDNIYFGIGIIILGTLGLMFLRGTSFWVGLLFSIPLAVLIPWLRMQFSYKHLKKGVKNPEVLIFDDHLLISQKKIELTSERKRVKSIKVIETKAHFKLLEFDIQWLTAKGPTNDEIRIPIPKDEEELVQKLISHFG